MGKNSRLERFLLCLTITGVVVVIGMLGPLERTPFMTSPVVRLSIIAAVLAAVLVWLRPWRRLD